MAFNVVVRPIAFADIDEATQYIAEQGNPIRAGEWREGSLTRSRNSPNCPTGILLRQSPRTWGKRIRQFHYHSHRVIYRILQTEVEVLRVYHGSRRALDSRSLPD